MTNYLDWTLVLTRGDNGFGVTWEEELEDGRIKQHHEYFEAADSQWGDHEAMQRCLYFITEHFGLIGSKHDPRRINIRLD